MDAAVATRFWSKVDIREQEPGDCWEWTASRLPKGYGQFGIKGRMKLAHRVSYELNVRPIPPGLFVLHSCDNPPCVNPAHLFLGTNTDNMADARKKGRTCTGEKHPLARLTEEGVLAIRLDTESTQQALADSFGVSRAHIGNIKKGIRW